MSRLPMNFPRNICAYCGSPNNLRDDHVPPKNLFPPRPRPALITVPACADCHSVTSKDDEYFRLKVCLRDDVGHHPDARTNWQTIFRSLKRDKSAGLARQVLSDIRYMDLKTPSGLYLGKRMAYDVDMNRIRRVVERVVRGLYFAESGNPLGLSNEVRVYEGEDLARQPRGVLKQLQQTILIPLAGLPPTVIGDGVFLYSYQIMKENSSYSVWAISFYGRLPFLAMTGPHLSLK